MGTLIWPLTRSILPESFPITNIRRPKFARPWHTCPRLLDFRFAILDFGLGTRAGTVPESKIKNPKFKIGSWLRVFSQRDHKVLGRGCTDVADSVFVVRPHESHGAWAQASCLPVDRHLERSLPDEEHLLVQVVMRRVGHSPRRELGLVDFQVAAVVEFARQYGA